MATLIITAKASQAKDLRAAFGARFGQILPAEGHLPRLAEPLGRRHVDGRSRFLDYFVGMSKVRNSLYRGHRFPAEVIAHAVWLYFRFPLSLGMVEDLLVRFPFERNRSNDKKSRKIKMLEQVLIAKVYQLLRNLL